MSKREQGFTLIELMIVVAIIAIIASIAIPNLLSARLNANESAAIATLKNISSSQAQLEASGTIDGNGNGQGEYGYFGELSGTDFVRVTPNSALSATERVTPPVLSRAFGQVVASTVTRSGYTFQMYLPSTANAWVSELGTGGATANAVGAGNAEVLWACFAWPANYPNSGKRAFFINQSGDVLFCRNSIMRYNGTATPPVPGTYAMVGGGTTMAATIAVNVTGADGERWTVVN